MLAILNANPSFASKERRSSPSSVARTPPSVKGIDCRVIDEIVDEELSIGDYVLTGGEIPACILVDCVARLCEGVLADPECYEKESISSGLLEYPQYTRPYEWHGVKVPDVLISGHHANIDAWRVQKATEKTERQRPDLLEKND